MILPNKRVSVRECSKESVVSKYLIQDKDVDVPFMPYLMKNRKKQLNKLNSYDI